MADIPINDVDPRIQLVDAPGGTSVYAYDFPIFEASDLVVEHTVALTGVTSTLVLTTEYGVSGVGAEGGGNVTLVAASAIDDIITIWRDVAVQRLNDYPTQGDFAAATLNKELDTMTMIMQQLERDLARTLRLSSSDTSSSLILPDKDDRADQYLFFDSNGNPTAAQNLDTGVAVITPFMKTLLDDGDAPTGRATLGINTLAGSRGADVAAAGDLPVIAGSDVYSVTGGITTINGLPDTFDDGALVVLQIATASALTFKDTTAPGAGFDEMLLYGKDIVSQDGDFFTFRYDTTASQWILVDYNRGGTGARRLISVQVFNINGTYTRPPGCTAVEVWCVGAGGGGGGAETTGAGALSAAAGTGGGGGGSGWAYRDDMGATETVTVGVGGTAGSSTVAGGNGGDTLFGALVKGDGGTGGGGAAADASNEWVLGLNNAFGGTPNIGGIRMPGGDGEVGTVASMKGAATTDEPSLAKGGKGGNAAGFGTGGGGTNNLLETTASIQSGRVGNYPGGGGSGGCSVNGSVAEAAGGVGGAGFCLVKSYG